MGVRNAEPGNRFIYGGRWYYVCEVTGEEFRAFDGWIHADFTFRELESPDQWRVVHLCDDDCPTEERPPRPCEDHAREDV